MAKYSFRKSLNLGTACVVALLLTGCNALDRVSELGQTPRMAAIEDPTTAPDYKPVKMPHPATVQETRQANSLWQTGSRAFFRDQRASRVGDILTVVISINDKASLQNESKRSRDNGEKADGAGLLGYQQQLAKWLPDAVSPSSLVDFNSKTDNTGKGSVNRAEKIDLRVAATILQILPTGNLVIHGKQQMVVNYEMRELEIAGVIRPQDISSENTVNYDQIAEARISYGGQGQISDVQQPRYGQQLYDILFPF